MKKLNIFDWLIIILVVVIIAGVGFRAEIEKALFTDEQVEISMQVKVVFLENARASTVNEGDEILTSNGKHLGTVKSVESVPSRDIVTVNGIDTEVPSAKCKDLTVTINLSGYITDSEYYTENGTKLLINDYIILETQILSLNCRIIDVQKAAEQ